ncbi:hypothetical protein GN496_23450 [Salmonella enterica]|nr:hypothetical protein [Salmonella enterica]
MGAGQKVNCCQGNALARGDNPHCGAVDAVQKVPSEMLKRCRSPVVCKNMAAANWRLFDSASIEWLPVVADSTCSVWRINVFNLKPATYQPPQTFPPTYGLVFHDRFCWHHYSSRLPA